MDKVKQKFEEGDVVQHKGSGRKAVIKKSLTKCFNSDHSHHLGFPITSTCVKKFSGRYLVQVNFDEEIKVRQYMIEKASETSGGLRRVPLAGQENES